MSKQNTCFVTSYIIILLQGLTVTCALSRAKKRVKEIEEFHEPLYWASFSVYGHDNIINVEELRRNVADASFSKAQTMAVERFPLDRPNEGGILVHSLPSN